MLLLLVLHQRERERENLGGWLVGWYNRAPFVSLGNRHEKKIKIHRINKTRPVSIPERIKNKIFSKIKKKRSQTQL
jgi:hypothetical protein